MAAGRTDLASGRPARGKRSSPARRRLFAAGRGLLSLVGVCLFVGFWEFCARVFDLPTFILPPASTVFQALFEARGELGEQLPQTITEAGLGLAFGAGAAFTTAVLVQRSKLFELTVLPFTVVLQSVPIVAITPVIALMVGRNVKTAIIIVAIVTFFPVLVNSIRGLLAVSDEELELLHVAAARRGQELWLLRFPTAIPFVFSGLRVAAALAIPAALVAEWTAGNSGLGFYISTKWVAYELNLVWAGIVFTTLLTVATFIAVVVVERAVLARLTLSTSE
jgi:NitT/TauT family transport system permease protein/putative hydroxymethylpyrimidine transport system permease protein